MGVYISLVVFLYFFSKVKCHTFIENDECATLHFKDKYFERFELKKWDQVGDLRRDFRSKKDGWRKTESVSVRGNCELELCNSAYFSGTCNSFTGGIGGKIYSDVESNITSASCICNKYPWEMCRCQFVNIPKNQYTFGRLYLHEGCNTCNSTYLQLYSKDENFTSEHPIYRTSVKAIVLRSDCTMIIYDDTFYRGNRTIISDSIVENFDGKIASYRVDCDSRRQPFIMYNKRLTRVPEKFEDLLDLASANLQVAIKSGVYSALKSLENGRSHKNAYIILIGESDVKRLGIHGCQKRTEKIGECRVEVNIENSGSAYGEVRIVTVNIANDPSHNSTDDARWTASLDEYLATHVELKDVIPNAVVIYHHGLTDDTISEKGSVFQRKLDLVTALSGEILDQDYSNLIFHFESEYPLNESKQLEADLQKFENVIDKRAFAKPVMFSLSEKGISFTPKEYGHHRMGNGEYWPKNLQEKLMVASKMGGDHLGYLIFEAAFPEEKELQLVHEEFKELMEWNHDNVKYFRRLLSNPSLSFDSCIFTTKKWLRHSQVYALKKIFRTNNKRSMVEQLRAHDNRFEEMEDTYNNYIRYLEKNKEALESLKLFEESLPQQMVANKKLENKIVELETVVERMMKVMKEN